MEAMHIGLSLNEQTEVNWFRGVKSLCMRERQVTPCEFNLLPIVRPVLVEY